MIDYSIVIPVYNEESRATKTLTQVLSFMNTFAPAFEIIVVDDGSKDKTADSVESYIKDHPEIKLIRNDHKGKGPTVRTGVLASNGKYIYTIDCDLSTPMDELKRLANWIIDNDYDIVIASREGLGAKREGEPIYRHVMGRVFNLVVQTLALKGIQDSQCGFKLYKNQVAKTIFCNLIVYGENTKKLTSAFLGAFDVEVLFIAKTLGYKIKEVPVKWVFAKTTRLNPLVDSYKMGRDVLRIKILGLKGAYGKPVATKANLKGEVDLK